MSIFAKANGTDEYLELIRKFPLKPIRDHKQLKAAHRVMDELTRIPEAKLTRDQADYLQVLGDLTLSFEQKIMSSDIAGMAGLEILQHLMDANDLSASDLGRLLNHRELGGKILRKERAISKASAKILGEHFGLPAEIFLRD